MSRLDAEREERLQPARIKSCKERLEELGYEVIQRDHTLLDIKYKGNIIKFWPYSGWHSGKGIQQGRGFKNLLKQLERPNG